MTYLRKNWFPVLIAGLAILVGAIYAGTPLLVKHQYEKATGKNFLLVQFKTYRNSLLQYTGRAREIYDGHFPPSDLSVGGNQPTVMNPLPPLIFSRLLDISHGGLTRAYILADFLFSILIFLGFVFVGWQITKSRLWAVFLGLVGVFTPIALILPKYDWHNLYDFFAAFIKPFLPLPQGQFDKLNFNLIDNPLLTFPFFLLAIGLFYRFWRDPKKITAVFAAIAAGITFYVYFHFWVYWVIFIGLLSLYVLLWRRADKNRLKMLLLFWAVLALLAAPYFLNYLHFSAIPGAQDYSFRLGMARGRIPGILAENLKDYLAYLAVTIAAYFLYWRRKEREKAVFVWALLGAMAVAWNIQLVIGYVPVPHTWYKIFSPVLFILLFTLAFDALRLAETRQPKLKKAATVLVIVLCACLFGQKIGNLISIGRGLDPQIIAYYKFPAEISDSWYWMNRNLPADARVLSSSTMTSYYLNSYTSARPYLPTAFTTVLTMPEIENRYLTSQKLFGVPPGELRQRLAGTIPLDCAGYDCFPDKGSNLNDSVWHVYGGYLTSKLGNFRSFLSAGDWDALRAKMKDYFDRLAGGYPQIHSSWQNAAADYVYYGPWEKQISTVDLAADPSLKLVYKNSGVEIYRILR